MRCFTRILISSIVLSVGFAAAASAADMAVKASPMAPVPASTWTGWYVGADIGAMMLDPKASTTSITGFGAAGPAATIPFAQPVRYDSIGFRGGVIGGYDWQFAPTWVAGVEADWHGETNRGTQPGFAVGLPAGPVVTSRSDNRKISGDWDGSIRARLGYLFTPSFLVFATGGGSWQHVTTSAFCDGTAAGGIIGYCANFGFPSQTLTSSSVRGGWTVGGGIETMLSAHWVARAEYRYSSYGTMGVTETLVLGALAQNYTYGVRLSSHVAEFGVRYKF